MAEVGDLLVVTDEVASGDSCRFYMWTHLAVDHAISDFRVADDKPSQVGVYSSVVQDANKIDELSALDLVNTCHIGLLHVLADHWQARACLRLTPATFLVAGFRGIAATLKSTKKARK